MPEGQELLSGLLDSAFEMAQDIKGREAEDEVPPSIKPIYERLSEMKVQLDQLCKLIFQLIGQGAADCEKQRPHIGGHCERRTSTSKSPLVLLGPRRSS